MNTNLHIRELADHFDEQGKHYADLASNLEVVARDFFETATKLREIAAKAKAREYEPLTAERINTVMEKMAALRPTPPSEPPPAPPQEAGKEAAGGATPEGPVEFAKCPHPPEAVSAGPRYPLRWGSSATEVCNLCGSYRLMIHPPHPWEPGPIDTIDRDLD